MRPTFALVSIACLALSACGGSQKKKTAYKERPIPKCQPAFKEELRGKLLGLGNLECKMGEGQSDFCALALYPPDAVSCLAELVEDRTPLAKTTQLPMVPGDYTVGDAAVLLASHMLEVPLQDLLPPEAEQRFGAEGMAVYFEAMSTEDGREAVRQGVLLAASRSMR